LTAGDDIDITGTTNATITLEDDIDLTALRASSASGLSLYEDGGTLGLFIEDTSGNVGIGTSSPEQQLTTTGNLQLGIADGDRYIYFDNGTVNNAGIRYNSTTNELEFSDNGIAWNAFGVDGGGVTSVTNADGTLTISPTTGDVVASLNLANANTWTGAQTFNANTYFPGNTIIDTAGNVGIGTTSPTAKLNLGKSSTASSTLTQSNSGDLALTGSYWTGIAEALHSFKLQNIASTTVNEAGRLAFSWDSSELLTLDSSGNLGLGDTTPTSKLTFATGTTAADGIDFGGDTTLYRSAADTLKTDDNFVLGTVGVGTTDSVITREVSGDLTARSIDSRVWGSSLVDGSGTTGYVTYWSDADTLTSEQYLSTIRGGLGGNVTAAGAG
ncbi:MAG: hypothetical protein ACOY3M_05500, partial [Patescibacteria group bacterium]